MSIRYYPSNKIKTNLTSKFGQFLLNGAPYLGPYYSTYDGKYYTGKDPITGNNEPLVQSPTYVIKNEPSHNREEVIKENRNKKPVSYFPVATEEDYAKGYLTRYFLKNVNQKGYVMEISQSEYYSIQNGTANYDISFIQTTDVLWKLTGPLNNKRVSQYDTRAGIIDTNKRLVETKNKTFVGLKEFIGEDYAKFARPTEQ